MFSLQIRLFKLSYDHGMRGDRGGTTHSGRSHMCPGQVVDQSTTEMVDDKVSMCTRTFISGKCELIIDGHALVFSLHTECSLGFSEHDYFLA